MKNGQKSQHAKVCHLTSAHSAFDDRLFCKEVKTLADEGYSVSLIAPHDKRETVNGVKIVPLPKHRNRFQRMIGGQLRLLSLALKEKADLYHFHDPDIIPIGLVLKLLGNKVIYDVHELVYYSIADKQWIKSGVLRKCVQFVYFLMEKLATKSFDRLVLAEDGYEEYFCQKHRRFTRYTIVRNFPVIEMINEAKPFVQKHNKVIVFYAGGLSRVRGIKELIASMSHLEGKAELHLLGKWESEAFQEECIKTKGYDYTKYVGYLPLSEVYSRMKTAQIGISILYPIKNYVTSLPVKAYEYIFCGLPMVMSNFPLWEKIFGQCALFADPYNPEEIAERIQFLIENPEKARQLGESGKKLVEEKYNWETEGKKLVDLYEKVLE